MKKHAHQIRSHNAAICLLAGLACAVAAIGTACSNGTPEKPATENRSTRITADTHGLHAVRNADLRMIMNKLHAMHLTEITDEIEMTGELQRDVCDVATMAESLAADAQLMPILLDKSTMTDEARRVMTSMSARLKLEAEAVARAANQEDLPNLRNNLRNMLDTCTACHHEFRAPTLAMIETPAHQPRL